MKVYHGKSNRRGIRDFSKKRYGNPLFRQTKRGRSRSGVDLSQAKLIGFLILAGVLLIVLCWYLFWSSTFRIENVEISGASPDTEFAVREIIESRFGERRALVLPQRSVF